MDTISAIAHISAEIDEKQCCACLVQHSRHQLYTLDSTNSTIMDDDSEQTIAHIYHQCTQLLYDPMDDHCKWICQCCTEKMIDFFQFRKMCIESYNTLKSSVMMKTDVLKVEIVDEFNDPATFQMEPSNTMMTRAEVIVEFNPLQSNEQNEKEEEEQEQEKVDSDDSNNNDSGDSNCAVNSSDDSENSNDAQDVSVMHSFFRQNL